MALQNVLQIAGIALMAAAAIGAAAAVVLGKRDKKNLERQLEAEYGPRRK